MKKLVGLLLASLFILGAAGSISAAERENVPLDKDWTVNFNTEMSMNDGGVLLYDAQWNPVDFALSYGEDQTQLIVGAEDAYEQGSTYTLQITDDLYSKKGVALQDERSLTFSTKPGASGMTDKEMHELVLDKTKAIEKIISNDLNENLGGERDFDRVEGELNNYATDSFVDGFLKDEYLNKACGGCDRFIFLYQPDFELHFEVEKDEEDLVRVTTVENAGFLSDGGYGTYEFKKIDGEWMLNEYTTASFEEGGYLNVTPLQGEKFLENTPDLEATYVRTVELEGIAGGEVRPIHVYNTNQERDLYVDSYNAFSSTADMLDVEPLSDQEVKQITHDSVEAVHAIINRDISKYLDNDTKKDYDRVRSELLEVATEPMVDSTLKEYYDNACGACDYRYFQEPKWNLQYHVLQNDGETLRVESAFPTSLMDDGGFEIYEFVLSDEQWLLNGVEQRDFTNTDHLDVSPEEAVQYLDTTDRGGDYTYVRTEMKEQIFGEGSQVRPYHLIEWEGPNGATDQLWFDSFTGFVE
ncbi:Ig-like domain-containing protein [Halobacillus litoralis]|uniref:Ig-like domain-containing protein n=1 Tax=Halobacillus litoralis TaxID=45668 RepID=UPI003990B55D